MGGDAEVTGEGRLGGGACSGKGAETMSMKRRS